MGYWGLGLYDNDYTSDIRDRYDELLQSGKYSHKEVREKIIFELGEDTGHDEETLLWLVLADIQWEYGVLEKYVKDKAISCIESDRIFSLCQEDNKMLDVWKNTLQQQKIKLLSKMHKVKEIEFKTEFIRNPWDVGDIYVYKFHTNLAKKIGVLGKYIAFQKIDDEEWVDGYVFSRVQILNCVFDKLPDINQLNKLQVLPFDSSESFISRTRDEKHFPICLNAIMVMNNKDDYPEKYFTYIGNQLNYKRYPYANTYCSNYNWKNLEQEFLCFYYNSWKKYDYKISEDGKKVVFLK